MSDKPLTPRLKSVLSAIVELYVDEGAPVGSKRLATLPGFELSPASIRHIMADLEELGLIVSPHTSAGRIPTQSGYRVFVDTIISSQPLGVPLTKAQQALLQDSQPSESLIKSASELLSGFTQMAGVVTVPKINTGVFRQVEFLRLASDKILVIIVLNDADIENRILSTTALLTQQALEQAGQYLTEQFSGLPLNEVRSKLFTRLNQAKTELNKSVNQVLEIAQSALGDEEVADDCIISGETHLFSMAKENGIDALQKCFEGFIEKRDLLALFDQCLKSEGVQIYIGEESGVKFFDDCSVITAPYGHDGEAIGVLGVVGPKRMPYQNIIRTVDMTAKVLSVALNSKQTSPSSEQTNT